MLVFFVLCALLACCCTRQSTDYRALRESAFNALEANMREMAAPSRSRQANRETNNDKHEEQEPASPPLGPTLLLPQGPLRPAKRTPATKRQRVTPFQAKHVAAAQGWRCGCGCVGPADPQRRGYVLDAGFEVDHRIPLRFGGNHHPSNWVAVLRSHHQVKSALESQEDARRNRCRAPVSGRAGGNENHAGLRR